MTSSLFRHIVGVALLCLAQWAGAAQAYVSLAGPGGSVSQFRPVGGPALRSFATPKGAVDILLSRDGTQLFVGTTSTRIADVQPGAPSVVAVLDPVTGAVLSQFAMPHSVVKMVSNAAEDHLYATGTDAATGVVQVMSLDLGTGQTVSAPVPGAQAFSLYPIAISRDGGTLFVPVTNAIAAFNAHTLGFIGSIALPGNGIVAPPFVTLDGTTLLAAKAGLVYVIDLASGVVTKTIPITTSAAVFGTALSPDGKTFYVSGGTLSAIDVPSLSVKGSVALGQTNPYRLGLSPDGTTLFATDLTYATTAVVDAATLTLRHTIHSIAPPFAVAVKSNGHALLLNENSNSMALVDTNALNVQGSFPVGDAPTTAVPANGKLFIAEVANMAVQGTPLAPTPARPIPLGFIISNTAVALGNAVYANSGSLVRVINPVLERATGSIVIRTGGGGLGSALSLAASGDGQSLLASYTVFQIDGGPIDGGIVKVNTQTGVQKKISSMPFVPNLIASNATGTAAFGIGFINGNQVGVWDTVNDVFLLSATLPGSPLYVGLGVSPDGATLYLVDQHGKVDFVNAATLQVVTSVPVGISPSGIAVSPDGTQAVVSDSKSSSVTVLNLVTRSVVGTVSVGAPSAGAAFLN